MSLKIFIIACEASGDTHGAHLIEELRKLEPEIECRGLGGPKMREAGAEILSDMTKISALGFGDVVAKYFTYRGIFYRALDDLKKFSPDLVILIDSPAFNLRFAKKIAGKVPVFYYISPQIWAWGGRRIATIKKTVSKMLVILPFETAIYERAGVPCEFVGHPLLDQVKTSADRDALRDQFEINEGQTAIALMPGSRESEVRRILPVMLKSASELRKEITSTVYFVTQSPNVPLPIYHRIIKPFPDLRVRIVNQNHYDLVSAMDFALVASGTATLETGLLGTPFFLLYKASWTTYWLGRLLIRVPYLGLVNLLAHKLVVPEFIQDEAHPETIAHEAAIFLQNRELYDNMKNEFVNVRHLLGEQGASTRAARSVLDFMATSKSK